MEAGASIASVSLVAALCWVLDGYVTTIGCVLRGLGWDNAVTGMVGGVWWAVGVPVMYYASFTLDRHLVGVWEGILAANATLAVLFTLLYKSTTWPSAADGAV